MVMIVPFTAAMKRELSGMMFMVPLRGPKKPEPPKEDVEQQEGGQDEQE